MESNFILIVGLGLVAFLLLYLSFKLDSEDKGQKALKFFTVCFVIFLLALIPKVAVDNEGYCEFVVQNETVYDADNRTDFAYDRICVSNPNATTSIFFTSYMWYIGIFGLWFLVYIIYEVFSYLIRLGKLGDGMIKKRRR